MHALPGAELHHSIGFEKTMVVGYYHGHPIFVEPMITRATLLERHSLPLTMPDFPDVPAASSSGTWILVTCLCV